MARVKVIGILTNYHLRLPSLISHLSSLISQLSSPPIIPVLPSSPSIIRFTETELRVITCTAKRWDVITIGNSGIVYGVRGVLFAKMGEGP